jgi:arylsulfatase K
MVIMKPNILVIHCDSMSGLSMGWVGHPAAHTPNLDGLAARGVGFANNYCNSPQCVPSRASLVSGQHTHNCVAWNNFKGLEPDDSTLFQDAEASGYDVRMIGRNDYRSGSHSLGARLLAWARSAGMDRPEKNRPQAVLHEDRGRRVRENDWDQVEDAGSFFDERVGQEQPFFCWLGFCQPHPMGGYATSRHYLDGINAEAVELPPHDPLEHPVCRHSSVAKHTFEPLDDEEALAVRRHYLGMVSEVDEMVGQVLNHLDRAGLTDDTVVVFFSDHGDMQLEHRQWLKNSFYEPCARVPLIFAGPGIASVGSTDDLVSLVDLRPTLAELMEGATPTEVDGRSLAPALAGRSLPTAPVLTQYHSNMMCTGGFMLREGDWKYVAYAGYEPQLFHVAHDPDEMVNLAEEEPARTAEMDERLRQIVDYERVDYLAKSEDRQCFRGWKKAVDDREYRESLAGLWRDFGEEQLERLDRWLHDGESSVRVD